MKKNRKSSMAQYGTSYKRGTMFFPEHIQEAVYILYTFLRTADDFVDNGLFDTQKAHSDLIAMQAAFHKAYTDNAQDDELLYEMAQLAHQYSMPLERFDDFFAAMIADTQKTSYETYSALQGYMRGSAAVVGLMMCKIVGYDTDREKEVFTYAIKLGEVMQYSNFLRDIKEDRHDHGRIYIPSDRIAPFGISHAMIQQFCNGKPINQQRKNFIAHETIFILNEYQEANKGISLLNKHAQLPVKIASRIYEKIAKKIYALQGDVFTRSARTTKAQKIFIMLQTVLTHEF